MANSSEILGDLLEGDDSTGEFVGNDGDLTEILAGDDSLGDDASGDDLIGAILRHKSKGNSNAAALAAKRIRAGHILRTIKPQSSRLYPLGLGLTTITGNSSVNINVQPQTLFRPERFVIPSNVAPDFLITDFKVGKNSQLVSPGALPAVGFTEQAFGVRLKMDTCQIAMNITISVTNLNAQPKNFLGMILGSVVE